MSNDVAGPDGSALSEGLGRVTGWQETCSRCKHLLRSGEDGNVWHCSAVRVGKNPAYAVTARAESWRKTAPARGKCGGTARLFEAA
jgi:hypothetical protein